MTPAGMMESRAPLSVQTELSNAAKDVRNGKASAAIPRLMRIATIYPTTREGSTAYYWLGRAYESTRTHRDAIEALDAYLQLDPDGRYAQDAAARRAVLAAAYAEAFPGPEQLDARIAEAQRGLASRPGDKALRKWLADLLWQRGNYEEAGKLYVALIGEDPPLKSDPEVMARIEPAPGGGYRVVTPQELQRRTAAARPLLIEHTHGYGAGRDRYTREHTYYVVAGEAYNQGGAMLYGVEVTVTIYGFASAVYDTKTVPLGTLRPGERRAFSVRLGNFETIENIVRFECVGRFQQ